MSYSSDNNSNSQEAPEPQRANLRPRAQRFPIETPVRYRKSGRTEWSEGTTVNISSSGVLFRCAAALEPKTMLEMQIVFPSEITGGVPANVVCVGPVVRSVPPSSPGSFPSQAAAILHYRFTHA